MPLHIAAQVWFEGVGSIPYAWIVLKTLPWLASIYFLKIYFQGATNKSERLMHSKVVMMTGGTSGIGAMVARGLAQRGAQLVLLTQHPLSDPFLVDYVMDLRTVTDNELITAEHVDLASLHSIRQFATKWIDNAPPRRLDMVILCANTLTPTGGKATTTHDGLESNWGLNYVCNFHLLSILSPALRAQPADRDVRVIVGTCSSYMGGKLPGSNVSDQGKATTKPRPKSKTKQEAIQFTPTAAFASSKLALMTFTAAFQKHLSTYVRPDKQPMNARVVMVDPGWSRTPGMRRFLSFGSLWGLALYLVMWPLWWLLLKSPDQGAQSFLWAAMEAELGRGEGGKFVKECREVRVLRDDIRDEKLQKDLWEATEGTIETLEKESAIKRANEKKQAQEVDEKEKGRPTVSTTPSADSKEKKAGSRRSRKAQ